MQTTSGEVGAVGSNRFRTEPEPLRALTKEELIDLVGASATKGDHLTRAEREVYAWQLVNMLHPHLTTLNAKQVEWLSMTKAERQATADELAKKGRPADPPPPGKTWQDMVIGQWPGDETDEEILAILEEIS